MIKTRKRRLRMIFVSFEIFIIPTITLETINITKPIRNDNSSVITNRLSFIDK